MRGMRLPLPRQTEKVHSTPRGVSGYTRTERRTAERGAVWETETEVHDKDGPTSGSSD